MAERDQTPPPQTQAYPGDTSYVFFASDLLSSYYTGEVLAPTGGQPLPG
jgi:hypothetical protein